MLQGQRLRLHRNTIVRTEGGEGRVTGYDAATQQWRVQMGCEEWRVDEQSMQLCFAVLPSSCIKVAGYVKISGEPEQGTCGRGLEQRSRTL